VAGRATQDAQVQNHLYLVHNFNMLVEEGAVLTFRLGVVVLLATLLRWSA
jgi:hypothetical protein